MSKNAQLFSEFIKELYLKDREIRNKGVKLLDDDTDTSVNISLNKTDQISIPESKQLFGRFVNEKEDRELK